MSSSLFAHLPKPGKSSRPAEGNDSAPQAKRSKADEGPAAVPHTAGSASTGDQVAAALVRIAGHIGHPKKFLKASPLLRELLVGGKVQNQRHARLLFEVLRLAMLDPEMTDRPEARREAYKLLGTAEKLRDCFTSREKGQLDVYWLWAVLRYQLHTDDSFQFNKALSDLKARIAALPDARDDEDDTLAALRSSQQDAASSDLLREEAEELEAEGKEATAAAAAAAAGDPAGTGQGSGRGKAPVGAAEGSKGGEGAAAAAEVQLEADPFGLDDLLEREQQQEEEAAAAAAAAAEGGGGGSKKRRSASSAWSGAECAAMRRQALLDCVSSAKGQYSNAWARTSYDLLVEGLATGQDHQRAKFTPKQLQELDSLLDFVRKQRAARKTGPSAAERRRDTTAFEAARAEWSKATVSARGKIGGGDHRTEAWLG